MSSDVLSLIAGVLYQPSFQETMKPFLECVCPSESNSWWDVAKHASSELFLHVYPMLYQYIGFLPFSNVIGFFVFFNVEELRKLQNLCPYFLEFRLLFSLLRFRLKKDSNPRAWNTRLQKPTNRGVFCLFLAQSFSFYFVQPARTFRSDASSIWEVVMFLTKFSLYRLFFNEYPMNYLQHLHKLKYYGKIPVIAWIAWWYYSLIVYSNITMKPVQHMQGRDLLCPNNIKDWRLTLVRSLNNENTEPRYKDWMPWVLQTLFLGKYDIQRMGISAWQMVPDILLIDKSQTLKTTWETTCKLQAIKTFLSSS